MVMFIPRIIIKPICILWAKYRYDECRVTEVAKYLIPSKYWASDTLN